MNGEHLEYSVECLEGGLWICKATSEDLGYIEQAMDHLKKIHPSEKFRYAIRTASDWCEMFREGGR